MTSRANYLRTKADQLLSTEEADMQSFKDQFFAKNPHLLSFAEISCPIPEIDKQIMMTLLRTWIQLASFELWLSN